MSETVKCWIFLHSYWTTSHTSSDVSIATPHNLDSLHRPYRSAQSKLSSFQSKMSPECSKQKTMFHVSSTINHLWSGRSFILNISITERNDSYSLFLPLKKGNVICKWLHNDVTATSFETVVEINFINKYKVAAGKHISLFVLY